jgi:hypothetical protein
MARKRPIESFDALSKEAKQVAVSMIEYCLERGPCMGMDEGYGRDDRPRQFRVDLETFVKTFNKK